MIPTFDNFINESFNDLGVKMDQNEILSLLQDALAEELNAWFQYFVVSPFLKGNERTELSEIYRIQGDDELYDHAKWLLKRINTLGGKPDKVISPDLWNKTATHKYIKPDSSFDVIKSLNQNIEAEKGAIETYIKLEEITRDKDIVTNTKVKEILADEQEHLQKLEELLEDLKK